jgi:signal peptidase II
MRLLKKLGLPVLLLVLADQLTKYLVRTNFAVGESRAVTSFFNLVYATNTGVAFSMFQGGNSFFIVFTFIAVAGFCFWYLKNEAQVPAPLAVPIVLILSGAIGNLLDRILYGHVVDFLDVYAGSYHWPSFNVADSCISVGGFILFILFLLPERKAAVPKKDA